MSLLHARGHERKKLAGHRTSSEPITLEAFRRGATEVLCEDCIAGDHEACRREGGYLDDEDNSLRCGCHLTAHALDNRTS